MTELERICAEINALPCPERLRMAADLFDKGRRELAHAIAERAVLEMGAALAVVKSGGKP